MINQIPSFAAVLLLAPLAALPAAEVPERVGEPNIVLFLIDDLGCELDAWRKDVRAEMMLPNPDYDPASETPKKGRKIAKPNTRE
jgi:hypothetical protein